MGNVFAAGTTGVSTPLPPLATPPPSPASAGADKTQSQTPTSPQAQAQAPDSPPQVPEDTGPGAFEDLHKKCKDIFPVPFEGAKLLINKGLSNHFQISHNLTMSMLAPSGYKFGCTYVGTKQTSPVEAYPILIGELEPSGNLNANMIHQLTKNIRCKAVTQIQNSKWVATQLTADWRSDDFTASVTMGNPDLLNGSGVIVSQYLQNVSSNLALGAELLYQFGPTVPGRQLGVYTVAARYSGKDWQCSSSLTPMALGLHLCYYHKVNDTLQMAVELEGSARTQECTATLGYQLELPVANLSFRGQLDSNWCVGATLEKRLQPLPFTFALSAFANHVKGAYRFGVGLIVG